MNEPLITIWTYKASVQLARYGLVGVSSNLAGYLAYLLVTHWGVEPKKAMTLLYIVGATIGFIGNRQWAFAHKGALLSSGIRYIIAHLGGYLINLFILLTLSDWLGYPHQWVQAAAIVIVAGFLFLVFKCFVFPRIENGVVGGK